MALKFIPILLSTAPFLPVLLGKMCLEVSGIIVVFISFDYTEKLILIRFKTSQNGVGMERMRPS